MNKIFLLLITGITIASCSGDRNANQDETQNPEVNSTEAIMDQDTSSLDAAVEEFEQSVNEVTKDVEELSTEIDEIADEI